MRWQKRLGKMCLALILGMLSLVMVLTIAYLVPNPWYGVQDKQPCDVQIYVAGDLFHTNLLVPVENATFNWRTQLPLETFNGDPARYRYLKFGWGDRKFYMETPSWSEVQLSSALRALFWVNPSAMHVQAYATLPDDPAETLKCVGVSRENYLRLVQFLQQSFQTDATRQKIRIGDRSLVDRGFFAAERAYSSLRTCNTWTAEGLRAARVKTPLWSGLAPAVMRQVDQQCCH